MRVGQEEGEGSRERKKTEEAKRETEGERAATTKDAKRLSVL